mgnify:FL=1|tara:strand:- start:2561 stop:3475 length:915 start_codon:yes stop_codon:yes gene_type:complete
MKSFINYSEKIGSNFLLCQGPGGNTSIKFNKSILIKRSGSFLSDSAREGVFKEIKLNNIIHHYKKDNLKNKKFHKDLSIETPLHVMLSSKYVLHYHSIASIIISSIYKKNEINSFLYKNEILPIKYVRPGLELAEEIVKLNTKYNFKSFFLYNHGIILEGSDIQKLYNKIFHIEKLFSKLIDYQKLNLIFKDIIKLEQIDSKIKNPYPDIKYKKFNGKYLFPDHSVFFPNFFSEKKNSTGAIQYDSNFFYFKNNLSETELIYFKTLLIIYGLINDNKIINYINKEVGSKLRISEDEILRIDINK